MANEWQWVHCKVIYLKKMYIKLNLRADSAPSWAQTGWNLRMVCWLSAWAVNLASFAGVWAVELARLSTERLASVAVSTTDSVTSWRPLWGVSHLRPTVTGSDSGNAALPGLENGKKNPKLLTMLKNKWEGEPAVNISDELW